MVVLRSAGRSNDGAAYNGEECMRYYESNIHTYRSYIVFLVQPATSNTCKSAHMEHETSYHIICTPKVAGIPDDA